MTPDRSTRPRRTDGNTPAIVQLTASRDQGTPMYRLAVRTDGGIIPLSDAYDTDEEWSD